MPGPRPKPWYWRARDAWYAQVAGRRVKLAEGKASRAAADAALYRHLALAGEAAPRTDLTVEELLDVWLEHSRAVHAPGTWATNRALCQVVVSAIGHVRLAGLTPGQLERFLAGRKVAVATKRAYAVRLRTALAWARREGVVPRTLDPLAGWRLPPMTRRTRLLGPDERAALLAAATPEFRAFLELLTETGARPHVLRELEARHVDWSGGVAELPSKGRPYRLYLTARAREILGSIRDRSGPLLRNTEGEPWTRNAIRLAFRAAGRRSGVKGVNAYAYRHSFATDALAAGANPAHVAELMGHAGLEMVSRVYSHLATRRDVLSRAAEGAAAAGRPGDAPPAPAGPPRGGRPGSGSGSRPRPRRSSRRRPGGGSSPR
jgi:integrase